jgi:putative transposase
MSERLNISVSESTTAIQEIKTAMKETKDLRMHQRYQVILMVLQGESYEKIKEVTGLALATLYNYSKAYRGNGLAGLKRGHSPGRPSLLTPDQEQKVYQTVVNKTPVDVGFPVEMNWTAPIVRKWIKQEFNVSYSERGARELLYRLNLSYTKPTYTLEKADPVKQEQFKQDFEESKKNS